MCYFSQAQIVNKFLCNLIARIAKKNRQSKYKFYLKDLWKQIIFELKVYLCVNIKLFILQEIWVSTLEVKVPMIQERLHHMGEE